MAGRKWKANSNIEWDDRTFLQRYRLRAGIVVLLVLAVGTLYYRYINSDVYLYGPNVTETQRAITACVDDQTRVSNDDDAAQHAASACVTAQGDNEHYKVGDKLGP